MNRTHFIYIPLAGALLAAATTCHAQSAHGIDAIPDSIDEAALAAGDSLHVRHHNTARGLNAMQHILEKRYVAPNETFTRRWSDHLFIEGGLSFDRIAPASDAYKYGLFRGVRLGVGKQLSRLSALRATFQGQIGYQDSYDYTMLKYNARLDYLFSLSDYFGGYSPKRALNVAAVAGAGLLHSRNRHSGEAATTGELHGGLQLKVYTGPHAWMALEPYAGIVGDQADVSANRNWRKYDFLYGVNLSYIYYINNNLSPEARHRYMAHLHYTDYLSTDSVPASWRQPWFVELSQGAAFLNGGDLSMGKSRGTSLNFAMGWWLSPVLGLRGSVFMRNTFWRQETNEALQEAGSPAGVTNYPALHIGGRAEALVNPLGFLHSFSWNSPVTGWMTVGMEYGKIKKNQTGPNFSNWVHGLTTGLHLAGQLADNLQLFVEPRYTWSRYHVPYNNVDWLKKYNDNGLTVEAGVTVYMMPPKYRRAENTDFFMRRLDNLRVGIFGGTNFLFRNAPVYDGQSNMGYNFGGFLEYRFDYLSSVRVNYEQTNWRYNTPVYYSDVYRDEASGRMIGRKRQGLWDYSYNVGLLSLAYQLNVLSFLAGDHPRTFTAEAFAGPTLVTHTHLSAELNSDEPLEHGHMARHNPGKNLKCYKIGAQFGVNLAAQVSRHAAIFLTPTFYFVHSFMPNGLAMPEVRRSDFFHTINVGVRYGFSTKETFRKNKK